MEDYEVRQALAIIKDRVNEIKQEKDWKQNIAEEWNQAVQEEQQAGEAEAPVVKKNPETQSVYSYSK